VSLEEPHRGKIHGGEESELRNANSHQKVEEEKNRRMESPLEPLEGMQPC